MTTTIESMSFWKKLTSRLLPELPAVKDDSAARLANMRVNQLQQQQIADESERLEGHLGVNGFTARFMLGAQMKAQENQ